MKFSPYCLPQNVLENFDTDLQVFYHGIVAEEWNLCSTKTVVGIRQALKDVVHAYKKPTVESHASQILFDSQAKRCAYVLKHCPCFGSAVAKHFLQLLIRNQDIQHRLVHRQEVNLCCLGGGPGTEAVAIVKVIDALSNLAAHCKTIHLRVWVVDLSKDWETTTRLVLKNVQQFPELCDSAKLTINFEMVEADLTKPFGEQVKKVLHDADVITMVYFVSAVNGSKSQNKCAEMLQVRP